MTGGTVLFVSAWGTLGDISPLVAVARAMKERGAPVHVAGVGDFQTTAERGGLDAREEWTTIEVVEGRDLTMAGLMNSDTGQRWLRGDWVPLAEKARSARMFRERADLFRRTLDHLVSTRNVKAVVCDISSFHIVSQVCQATGVTHIVSTPMPYQPSQTFTLSRLRLFSGRFRTLNRAYWWWRRARKPRSFRRYFDHEVYHLLSASRVLFPRPFDWPPNQQVTGYCSLPMGSGTVEWKPPPQLSAFLENGDPPVYVGFGSYPFFTGPRGASMLRMICDTLSTAGKRAVVCTGFSRMEAAFEVSDGVYIMDQAPHEWLLPRCAFALHHGGGGTTFACLKAGIPMIAYPYQTDQFFWARRIGELGIGPGSRHAINRISSKNLAGNLRYMDGAAPFEAATRLGGRVREEADGAMVQAEAIGSIIEHSEAGGIPGEWRAPFHGTAP